VTAHWPVQIPVLVRERDCGSYDELDESSLLVFFREARRAYLSVLNASDADFRVRVIDVRFRLNRLISLDDDLAVHIRCDVLGAEEFRFEYRVRDRVTGETVAVGSSAHGLVAHGGSCGPIPLRFRERVAALEGRDVPFAQVVRSEVDDGGVVAQRSVG
jgi:acyl-CoA thioesterase FadM